MTRLGAFLTIAGLAGTATAAPPRPAPAPAAPAQFVAPVSDTAVTPPGPEPSVAWLASYGRYDRQRGTWALAFNTRGC